MPDSLLTFLACAGLYVAVDLVLISAMWVIDRLWGIRGVAWVLGKTEDEVIRMRRPPRSGT